jgi:hypothetical protein
LLGSATDTSSNRHFWEDSNMGHEATVQCRWAQEAGLCKVLLETHELIVRGTLRRRVPIAELQNVSVENEELHFNVGGDAVSFSLGSALAQRWAKAITTPPPSLAAKLGISGSSRLLLLGEIDSDELQVAVAEAATTNSKEADLIIASVRTPRDLKLALARLPKNPSDVPPLWIVYPKGAVNDFGEASVREVLRGLGFIDTKVASVSSKLTALRFIWRSH